jgi:hypothetical protein
MVGCTPVTKANRETACTSTFTLDRPPCFVVIISNNVIANYSETNMPKATIKTQSGAVITIEGSEKEISHVLADFERSTLVTREKEAVSKKTTAKKEQKKRSAVSDLVVSLKEDGYFDKPKGLVEIAHALQEVGHLIPVTTLSGVMLGLVQKKLFRRKKVDGKWVYGK